MQLKYTQIVNFRSIKTARIDFDQSCRILVGINESGKTNILKALSMIGESASPNPDDIREPLLKEKSIDSAYIRFVFKLSKDEKEDIFEKVKEQFLSKKIDSPLLKKSEKNMSLKQFCDTRDEGLYSVDVKKQNKQAVYWGLSNNYILHNNWKAPSSSCPADYQIDGGGKLKDYKLVNTSDYKEIPNEYLEDANVEIVNNTVGSEIVDLVRSSLPEVIFWKYEEENLLPPSVNIAEFIGNPDICKPLKNMFNLAGIQDIKSEIESARSISQNKFRNLLKRISNQSTKHFRGVWKEYKEIKFALEPNADEIEANIVEKNHWRMSQRSDGMKRFITFLLHISANVKTNLLTNALVLIDEPDLSLHPTGSRYLRDELIDISKKNNVVFSTHSIFMIDRDVIERHLIIKKDNEITTAKSANKSNFVDEEVLFNALNYTVFDILKKDNILFEGWRDKRLFEIAISKIPTSYKVELKELQKKIKTVGMCHAEGVKDVKNLTPLLELAGRNCLIISDSDNPAKEKQKEHIDNKGYGEWKRYDEILEGEKVETAEDFIKELLFKESVKKVVKKHQDLDDSFPINSHGRIDAMKGWLAKKGKNQKQIKEILNEIKTDIFDNLKPSDVDDNYYELLKKLTI